MAFYSSRGTNLDKYFPAYEYSIQNANVGGLGAIDLTINLTRNADNSTTYMVFYTFFNDTTTDYSDLTKAYSRCIVYNKTSSNFKFFIYNNTNTSFIGTGTQVMFWIVYVTGFNSQINTQPNTGYTDVNGAVFSSYFPEYYFCVDNLSTAETDYTFSPSLSVKGWPDSSYHLFSSYESGITDPNNIVLLNMVNICDTVLYGTTVLEKTTTSFNYYLRITDTTDASNMKINTIALLPASNTAYNSNYNVTINSNTIRLNQYYPECEFFYIAVQNNNTETIMTCTLTAGKNTLNYIVIVGSSYNSPGTSGTYNPWNASQVSPPVIISKTATSFTAVFTKGDGNNWNGGFQFIVIYY
jgi:hypothetical protein